MLVAILVVVVSVVDSVAVVLTDVGLLVVISIVVVILSVVLTVVGLSVVIILVVLVFILESEDLVTVAVVGFDSRIRLRIYSASVQNFFLVSFRYFSRIFHI